MTIAVIWQEEERLWCAADTRLVAGDENEIKTEIAAKIYSIPVVTSAMGRLGELRQAHYWTQYGFVFAGSVAPAVQTAVTASSLLQKLALGGGRGDPPTFQQIAEFVHRLAKRFMDERRSFRENGLFSAALFGWCPYADDYVVAHLDGRGDGGFRVDLSYPSRPEVDGHPWLILGGAAPKFKAAFSAYKQQDSLNTARIPRRVIDKMVAEGADDAVGGATALGVAYEGGFDFLYALEPVVLGKPEARRIFNGLDLDADIGTVGQYEVAIWGQA